jgi:hypothetical protein
MDSKNDRVSVAPPGLFRYFGVNNLGLTPQAMHLSLLRSLPRRSVNNETPIFSKLVGRGAAERRKTFSLGREPQGEEHHDSNEPPKGAANG